MVAIRKMLTREELEKFEKHYLTIENRQWEKRKRIAVVSAGNIPIAGFHDFFAVLISGNDYMGKLSSQDNLLLPAIADLLISIEPEFQERISFVDKLTTFDKIIATGSNNSARYFEYYFGKYPHILRKNRNSLAILTGEEQKADLEKLYHDLFLYFGLGCRSVSMLWVPENYDFIPLIHIFEEMGKEIAMHHHLLNNLDYQKTMHLMNQTPFLDAGIALLIEKPLLPSPIGVIHYQYYRTINEVKNFISSNKENIQCVVGNTIKIENIIPFGEAQFPHLTDFADGIDSVLWATEEE